MSSLTQHDIKHVVKFPSLTRRFTYQEAVCRPTRSAKFTPAEWQMNRENRAKITNQQYKLADRLLEECDRVRCIANERVTICQSTSDSRHTERINVVETNVSGLKIQKNTINLELEALKVYKVKLDECLASLEEKALKICRNCLIIRDGRLGIDLVIDEVEQALQNEINLILRAQTLLRQALEQLMEQMRRLRAVTWALDRDLKEKDVVKVIDKPEMRLRKPRDLSALSLYEGYCNFYPKSISYEDWMKISNENIRKARQEVNSARIMKTDIDTLVAKMIEDLTRAYEKCNNEFKFKIEETKRAKEEMEELHSKIETKIQALHDEMRLMEYELRDKEKYTDFVKEPGSRTVLELTPVRQSIKELQQTMQKASATIRYLLQTRVQLEEEINIKKTTLKIDEVDCMTLRLKLKYHGK